MAAARVAVLGGGAWGSVLAAIAARHGHDVTLWEKDVAAAEALERDRMNQRSVPGFRLPDEVRVFSGEKIGGAVADRDLLVVAVPSDSMWATMDFARVARGSGAPAPIVLCASKGLEPERGATMAEVIALGLPGARVGMLSGPSFAAEIARGLPAALVAASTDGDVAAAAQACFGGMRVGTDGLRPAGPVAGGEGPSQGPSYNRPVAADHDGVAGQARVVLGVIEVVVQAAALRSAARAFDDQVRDQRDVAQLDQVAVDGDVPVVIADLVANQLDAPGGPLQASIAAHDADVVPHQAADLVPVVADHDHLVGRPRLAGVPGRGCAAPADRRSR